MTIDIIEKYNTKTDNKKKKRESKEEISPEDKKLKTFKIFFIQLLNFKFSGSLFDFS